MVQNKKIMNKKLKIVFYTLLIFVNISYSQSGVLDTSFGNNGAKILSIPDKSTRGKSIITLSDKSIIAGINSEFNYYGYPFNRGFYIYKLFPNGQIDNSFGTNGYLFYPNQGNQLRSLIISLTKLNNDDIIVDCLVLNQHKVIKIDKTGHVLWTTTLKSGINFHFQNIGIQSDNKIIVPGQYYDGYHNNYCITRLNPNGTIDTSFGNNGMMIANVTPYRFDFGASLAIQNDDKIIIVGTSYNIGDDLHAVISRFNSDGSIDTSFGNNGTIIAQLINNSVLGEFIDVKLNSDGTIIVGGNAYYLGGQGGFQGVIPTVVKYTTNGHLDLSFGNNGIVNLSTIFNANDYLRTINIQPDGKILIGGDAAYPFPFMQTYFYIARLNENGTLDTNFGNNGAFLSNFQNSKSNYTTNIKFQDDYILALGCRKIENNNFRAAVILRLNNRFLSVNENAEYQTLIYPNPVKNKIFIKSVQKFNQINVYNLQGKLLQSGSFDLRKELTYDMTNLKKGFYYIQIRNNNEEIVKKIIIKN